VAKVKDIIGKTFYKLTAIKLISTRFNFTNKTTHEFLCDCGNKKILDTNQVKIGNIKSCGCLQKEKRKSPNARINRIILSYKSAAFRRNIKWELSKEEVLNIIFLNCYYCDSKPNNECRDKKDPSLLLKYNGIDRVDSELGYIKNNCVPCCFKCNRGKSNMSQKDFINWIKNVYNKVNNNNKL
jgi:hypothetical protein